MSPLAAGVLDAIGLENQRDFDKARSPRVENKIWQTKSMHNTGLLLPPELSSNDNRIFNEFGFLNDIWSGMWKKTLKLFAQHSRESER